MQLKLTGFQPEWMMASFTKNSKREVLEVKLNWEVPLGFVVELAGKLLEL